MTKLLFITAGLYFDPTDEATVLRYETLSKGGFSGLIICVVYDRKHSNLHIGNFQLVSLYLPAFLQGYGAIRGLARALYYSMFCLWKGTTHRSQYETSIGSDTFKSGMLCYILSALTKRPYIIEVAGNYIRAYDVSTQDISLVSKIKQAYVKMVSPFTLKHADAIKLLYKTQLDGLATINDLEKVHIFHDTSAFEELQTPDVDEKFILSAGHPWHLKGMDITIRAFNKIQHEIPDYKLCIAGYCTDISEYVKLADSNPQIIFYEKGLESDQMKEKFRTCSLYVLASRSEAMGRVLLEAMASKKPIVASEIDGVPRIIQHEHNGLLFEPENVDELATKILRLIQDKAFAEKLIKQASTDLQTKFSCKQFMTMYADMVTYATRNK